MSVYSAEHLIIPVAHREEILLSLSLDRLLPPPVLLPKVFRHMLKLA